MENLLTFRWFLHVWQYNRKRFVWQKFKSSESVWLKFIYSCFVFILLVIQFNFTQVKRSTIHKRHNYIFCSVQAKRFPWMIESIVNWLNYSVKLLQIKSKKLRFNWPYSVFQKSFCAKWCETIFQEHWECLNKLGFTIFN